MIKSIIWVAAVTILGSSASAAGANTPLDGTKELVAAVKAGDKSGKAQEKVRDYFDYDHLVETPIEPHKDRLNTEQMARYSKMFRQLLENAPLIASVGDSGTMDYKVGKPVQQKSDVRVNLSAYNPKTDMETEVAFVWRKHNASWRVVDVTLDGVSLVKGYQNQFGRILNKEGAEGLLSRLEKRLAEVKNGGGNSGS